MKQPDARAALMVLICRSVDAGVHGQLFAAGFDKTAIDAPCFTSGVPVKPMNTALGISGRFMVGRFQNSTGRALVASMTKRTAYTCPGA